MRPADRHRHRTRRARRAANEGGQRGQQHGNVQAARVAVRVQLVRLWGEGRARGREGG